jgi:hypothetical protein
LTERQVPVLLHELRQVDAGSPFRDYEYSFFHLSQVLDFDQVAVDQFGTGGQVAAELFFRGAGEPGYRLQDFEREFPIPKTVANPVRGTDRAGANLLDYLVFADRLHFQCPAATGTLRIPASLSVRTYLLRSDGEGVVYMQP